MPDQGGADVVEHAGYGGPFGVPGKRLHCRTRFNTPPGSSRSYHENFFTWSVFVAYT